jgi:Peptidase_C39 like family
MNFEEIRQEIDNGNPIAVSIQWQEPAAPGHAIVIYGYTEDQNLIIGDPQAPKGTVITVPFNNFTYPEVGGSLVGSWKAAFRTIRAGE